MKGFLKSKLVLSLVALVLLAGAIAIPLSGSITRSHAAPSTPAPPFTQCPAIGADTSCGILIVFNADGTTSILSDPSQGPFDSIEDTLVGVQNNSGVTIPNTTISGTGIFGFDGDGICSGSFSGTPAGCPFGPTGYEGPNTSFSIVDANNGTVNFTSSLAPGASTYFSLEGALSASSITIPATITLNPPTATNVVGTNHTVTATVAGSQPVVGTTVTFTVVSGPNAGATGTCSVNANCTTDASGQVSFTYASNGTVGTDTIQACFTDNTGQHCATATKDWVAPKSLPGRMTGGGTIGDKLATHGFELQCDTTKSPNSLEVNWGKNNKFHLDTLTSALCSDDPTITPNPPSAGFDTYKGTGAGTYNGVAGATVVWTFTDAGEPGTNDSATITIKDVHGNIVLNVSGKLSKGNQQAHNP